MGDGIPPCYVLDHLVPPQTQCTKLTWAVNLLGHPVARRQFQIPALTKMLCKIAFLCLFNVIAGGLLGAGTGEGSCPAAPYRTDEADLKYTESCPGWAECCTEYGYCQPKSAWEEKLFRDCNGESNGLELPDETKAAELEASSNGY